MWNHRRIFYKMRDYLASSFISHTNQIQVKKQLLFMTTAAMLALASCGDAADDAADDADTTAVVMDNTTPPPTGDTMMAGSAEQGVMVGGAMMVPSKDIVDNAMGSNEHTTLVAAVKQAGLVETLKGAGPFTVFAPTNMAFDAVGKDKVDGLMKDENKDKLAKTLKMHVVSGSYRAADLKDGQELTSVEGKKLKVQMKDGKVMVAGATVTTADVISSNGVTHVVDKVIM